MLVVGALFALPTEIEGVVVGNIGAAVEVTVGVDTVCEDKEEEGMGVGVGVAGTVEGGVAVEVLVMSSNASTVGLTSPVTIK